ncbi:MAG: helix-turn-helix domain-containing protein [Bacteroidota bacterium]
MTAKQLSILNAALKLFAQQGFSATPTSQIAKAAGVSEGLIFRHFGKKEGLLEAVVKEGEESFKTLFADVAMASEPKEVIRKAISMPFGVPESDYEFWRLQFKLKWELDTFHDSKVEPMKLVVTNAFQKLGYEDAALEAETLLHLVEGVGSAMLKGHLNHKEELHQFLLKKYNL